MIALSSSFESIAERKDLIGEGPTVDKKSDALCIVFVKLFQEREREEE
jgi:hypothetical protein